MQREDLLGSYEKIKRLVPTGASFRVLDIGCGDGRVMAPFLSGHRVCGLDADAAAVSKARERGIVAHHGRIEERWPFADSEFDIVFALDVIEHCVDLKHFFDELNRVTMQGGYFILAVPNHFDLRTRFEMLFGKGIIRWSQRMPNESAWQYEHIRFFTRADIRTMLVSNRWFPELWQYNFMSQGLLPTRLLPAPVRRVLARLQPGLWSGKFVVRARREQVPAERVIILDRTPDIF